MQSAPLNQVTFEDGEVGVIWKGKNCDKTAFSWELYCPGSVPMEAIELLLCPSRGVPVGEDTVVPEEVQQPPLGWALINLRIKLHKYNTTCVAWSLSNEKKNLETSAESICIHVNIVHQNVRVDNSN